MELIVQQFIQFTIPLCKLVSELSIRKDFNFSGADQRIPHACTQIFRLRYQQSKYRVIYRELVRLPGALPAGVNQVPSFCCGPGTSALPPANRTGRRLSSERDNSLDM